VTLTSELLVPLSIGGPLTLLAIGVLAHAVLLARRPAMTALEDVDEVLEALAAEPVEDLLIELHQEIDELRSQLAGQRSTLEQLLSEGTRQARAATAPEPASRPTTPRVAPMTRDARAATSAPALATNARPMVLGARSARTAPSAQSAAAEASHAFDTPPAAGGIRAAVSQLAAEGLSDRAIARRLHVGLEEVRVARLRAGVAQ